jgi:hypothetical protein
MIISAMVDQSQTKLFQTFKQILNQKLAFLYLYQMVFCDILEPTAPPTNVTAYNTSSMGIIAYWSRVPAGHRNGHILGFKVCYRKASEDPKTKLCLSVYALSIHFGGLEPYTPYYITVLAYTNIGDGPASTPLLVWTNEFGKKNYEIFLFLFGRIR